MDTNQTVAKKSKQFAIHVMKLVEHLRKNKRPYFIIDQVGRSGTSIGANVMEAEHAITQKEFLQKMYIAYKECNETLYWLELILRATTFPVWRIINYGWSAKNWKRCCQRLRRQRQKT